MVSGYSEQYSLGAVTKGLFQGLVTPGEIWIMESSTYHQSWRSNALIFELLNPTFAYISWEIVKLNVK